jgi:hypothetical protein
LSAFALKIAVKTTVFQFGRNGTQKLKKPRAAGNYIFQIFWFNPGANKTGVKLMVKIKEPERIRSGWHPGHRNGKAATHIRLSGQGGRPQDHELTDRVCCRKVSSTWRMNEGAW